MSCPLGTDLPELLWDGDGGHLNGLLIPDRLLGPLVISAAAVVSQGSNPALKRVLPPRLLPLAGGLRKFGAREQRAILTELGYDRKFTESVFEVHAQSHGPCVAVYEGRSIGQILDDLEQGLDDADHVVCILLAARRQEEAGAVADWVDGRSRSEFGGNETEVLPTGAMGRPVEVHGLSRELKGERRLRRRAEAEIKRALRSEESALRRAAEAEDKARKATEELVTVRSRVGELETELNRLQDEVLGMSRERRTLLVERERLLQRWLRTRRELRLARSKLREDGESFADVPLFEVCFPDRRPSVEDLDARYQDGGASMVLDARALLLLVDGWNVALNHMLAGNLRDRRLRLERTLAGYEARTGNRVLVVYDGREDVWSTMPQVRGILRVFTPEEETADDYIVSELEVGTGALAPVVATTDWDLGRRCRKSGAFVVTSSELARFLKL